MGVCVSEEVPYMTDARSLPFFLVLALILHASSAIALDVTACGQMDTGTPFGVCLGD